MTSAITEKLPTPQELGCQRPFSLTYKARLRMQSEQDRDDLLGFLEAYRRTAQRLAAFFVKQFRGAPAERVAACLLVCPRHFPPDVVESEVWQAVSAGETTGLLPKKWHYLIESTLYQNLRALAGRDEQPTKGGAVVQKIWAKFNLPAPSADEFDGIFRIFSEAAWRTEAANAVQGALRSYFSMSEVARRESIERNTRRAALHAQAPGFFNWLALWLEDARGYVQACRLLRAVRRELFAEKVDRAVVRACQSSALLQRVDAQALWPRLVDTSINANGTAHPQILARIAAAIPVPIPPIEMSETDSIRRFCSAIRPIESLEREPGLIKEILRAVQNEWRCFEAEEFEAILNEIVPHGAFFRHKGWIRLCRSTALRDKKVVALVRDAREYARLLRPIKQAELKADVDFWPVFPFGQRFGWEWAVVPAGLPANTAAVSFDIPSYSIDRGGTCIVHEKRKIMVLLRGYLPGNGAELLEEQIDVKAGPFQFRPDRRKPVFGQHPQAAKRHVFVKPQGLRLVRDRSGLAGAWTALHMAETPVQVSKERPLFEALKPGQRLGVLVLLPGGSVLCDVLVFERISEGLGWKLITVEETRPRTDSGMRKGSERGNPQPWICKRRPFVRLDAAAVDAQLAHLLADAAGKASPDVGVNRQTSSWKGRVWSALGDTAYKQLAARTERLLSWNRCDGVLIAGGGFLRGQTRLQHPLRRFYSLGTRSGYLLNAVNRLGLPWAATTARPGKIWMKDYFDNPAGLKELRLGLAFRRLRREELAAEQAREVAPSIITTRGAVTHIAIQPDGSRAVDYAINAGWAVLLAWASPEFNKLATTALASSGEVES